MNNHRPRILYVEDDLYLSYVTRDNLNLKGYDITFCKDGKEALETFRPGIFDLCILDVMLPEVDGFTLAKKIRKTDQHIPIIFLSAKSLKEDRIEGLLSGGDDYLTKPFSIEELILKIEVFLKRRKVSDKDDDANHIVQIGEFTFDPATNELRSKIGSRRLTSREADLLRYLVQNMNKIAKKEDILHHVWDSDSYFNSRSLDVFISRLRKYLKDDPQIQLNNVHGIGFILSVIKQ